MCNLNSLRKHLHGLSFAKVSTNIDLRTVFVSKMFVNYTPIRNKVSKVMRFTFDKMI